jgi:hypothetical protein
MKRFFNKVLLLMLLTGVVQVSFADRGGTKKNRQKAVLNIHTNTTLKSAIALNFKNGLKYKGAVNPNHAFSSLRSGTLLTTYQKGNTTYIIPYKHKTVVPEMRQGYTGIKMIIRPKH